MAARLSAELKRRLLDRIAEGGAATPTVTLRSPLDGSDLAEIPALAPPSVAEAAVKAHAAQRAWAARSMRERARVLLRFHDLILERQDEILDIIQLETGKARRHAFEEVLDAAICARHYAFHAGDYLAPKRRRGALPLLTATWEVHPPLGLVGFIAPWNYPLSLGITDALAALAAGNAAILKPDQQTPLTALWAVDLLYEAGLPADLFQVTTGSGRELAPAIIDEVDFVCFTGSTATGRIIARLAAERLIGCSLELGGKNPLIILDDADLERAVDGAVRACFANTGQLCISTERLFVQSEIYDRFVPAFAERVRALKLAADFSLETEIGSLASAAQLDKVGSHVRDAVDRGAKLLAGGRPRPELGPFVYEPTVLAEVTPSMALFGEETFGPVVAIYRFDDVEAMIEQANATRYGLNASLWTRNTRRGREIAARIECGTVNINEAYAATWGSVDAPMGGFKDSGLGRRHGAHGVTKYTEAQTISVQRFWPIAAPPGVSEPAYERIMTRLLRLLRWIPGLR